MRSAFYGMVLAIFGIVIPASAEDINFRLNFTIAAPHAVYYLAQQKGWFEEEGLNVAITPGSGSTDSVRLTAAGQFNLAEAAGSSLLLGRSQGIPVKAVAMIYQNSPTVLMALKSSNINNLEDLYGHSVGVRYKGAVYPEYQALLAKNNIDRSKINEVSIGNGNEPLFTGQVDVISNYIQELPRLTRVGGKEIVTIPFREYGVNFYGTAIITSEDTLKNNGDAIRRFLRVVSKSWNYIVDNPEEGASALVTAVPELDRGDILEELRLFLPLMKSEQTEKEGWGFMDRSRWETDISFLSSQGVIEQGIEADDVFSNDFLR